VIPWLQERDRGRIRHIVRRLGLRWRRGRAYLHSPDLAYDAKLRRITGAQMVARYDPAQSVLLYADEFTYYRRPTIASALAPCGSDQPRARFGLGFNTKRRIACCLNAMTGRLTCWHRARFDHATLLRFYRAVAAAYPEAERIFLVHDNWKVHTQPDLLAGLADGPMLPLLLPTYAPWTNPVEQVWRQLHADVLHLHEFAENWDELTAAVTAWLAQWQQDSPALLHTVGLWPD
jgi:transposase